MDIVVICLTALLASLLTLFSGFGLGTLLMPVVALFFPVEIAIGITALVHLANNLFKVGLLGRQADRGVLLRFGLPGMAAAVVGAALLARLEGLAPWFVYTLGSRELQVLPIKAVVGVLIVGFVVLEFLPAFARLTFGRRWLPLGGLVSGFFGGLSGHQGAFRSLFLLRAGLDTRSFVATGVMLAVMVDLARLAVYGGHLALGDPGSSTGGGTQWALVGAASLAAFAGSWLGNRFLHKVTLGFVRTLVAVLLAGVGLGLLSGVV